MAKPRPAGYTRQAWESVSAAIPEPEGERHPMMAALYAEHRYMWTLLRLLGEQLQALQQGSAVNSSVFYEAMHYLTHFPDAFHHPREDLVYARAGELDPSLQDSVDTLQRDHDYLAKQGRAALEASRRWRDGRGRLKTVVDRGEEYIGLMYQHMSAEEKLVFPQIERLLTAQDWLELERDDLLQPVSDPVFGPRVGREYRRLARTARRAMRRGVEDAALAEWMGFEAVLEAFEVFSMAADSSRDVAREHIEGAVQDTREMVETAMEEGGLIWVPMRATINNTGRGVQLVRELASISADTLSDLGELNSGLRKRLGFLIRGDSAAAVVDADDANDHTLH